MSPSQPAALPTPPMNKATARLKIGRVSASTKLQISTAGVFAVAGLVTSILLSTTALVWVATAAPRARPTLALLRRR